MKSKKNRRAFLNSALKVGAGLIWLPLVAQSCKSEGDQSTGAEDANANALDVTSCDDLSKTSAAEIKKREGFGYVEESPIPEKHCKNCQLYLPPTEGKSCGGCALFKGPVFEEAYCTYWAPIV